MDESDITIIMNSPCFPGNVRIALGFLGSGATLVIAKMHLPPLELADAVQRNKVTFSFSLIQEARVTE